jgi:glycine cleavage system protein P-like pyridoxal-binding family
VTEENEVVRHYTNLSQMNFGVDIGIYPWAAAP